MKKRLYFFLALSLLAASLPIRLQGAENSSGKSSRRGDAAGYSCRDATVLSMMGWGIGLAVGIAFLCAILEQNTGPDHGHSHSHSHSK